MSFTRLARSTSRASTGQFCGSVHDCNGWVVVFVSFSSLCEHDSCIGADSNIRPHHYLLQPGWLATRFVIPPTTACICDGTAIRLSHFHSHFSGYRLDRVFWIVTSWYQLVPAGTSWSQLVPAGTSWYQLVPAGTSWYQLGTSWYQLIPASTGWYQLGTPAGTSWYRLVPAGPVKSR